MNKETLKEIYQKYNLDKEDIFELKFGSKAKHIITRTGIEKIQAHLGIQMNYKIEKISDDFKSCVILATGAILDEVNVDGQQGQPPRKQKVPKIVVNSFGEASPSNNKNSYPICMAEKRGKSRVVLQISGLYQLGIYSEDEADEFKKQ